MFPIVRDTQNQIFLIVARRAAREQMLEWIAAQACRGAVHVIDGGNHFNVYKIAKLIRRQTSNLHQMLQNIKITRSFSCYQMEALLGKTANTNVPIFILDFLFSFYDEDIHEEESVRLLRKSFLALKRLNQHTTLVISTRPLMYSPNRSILLEELKDIATMIWEADEPVLPQPNPPLLLPGI